MTHGKSLDSPENNVEWASSLCSWHHRAAFFKFPPFFRAVRIETLG
jgi:hypothetical protein